MSYENARPRYLGTAFDYHCVKNETDFLILPNCQMDYIELWLLCHPYLEAQNALHQKLLQHFAHPKEESAASRSKSVVVPFETVIAWISIASRCHIENLLPAGETTSEMTYITKRLFKSTLNVGNDAEKIEEVDIEAVKVKIRQLVTLLSFINMDSFTPDESTMLTFSVLRLLMDFEEPMEEIEIRRFLQVLNQNVDLDEGNHPLYATFPLISEDIFDNLRSAAIFSSCIFSKPKVSLQICIQICIHCLQKPEFVSKVPTTNEDECSLVEYTNIICDNIAAIIHSVFRHDEVDRRYFDAFRDCLGWEFAEKIRKEHVRLEQLTA